jgi:Septum formation
VTILLTAVGCSGDQGSPGADAASGAAGTPTSSTTSTTVPIVGDPVNQYTLVLGDCFNRYEVDKQEITAKVPCEGPHQREVFATLVHPSPFGDPWPGDDALQRYGLRLCYQGFEAFVGIIYELSELGIGVLTPPQINWEDAKARYRGITCYLVRNDGQPLMGSMRGKAV